MRKCNLLRISLLNSLLLLAVPGQMQAAFEISESNAIAFALANMASFPPGLLLPSAESARLHLSVSGARLYGMPEIQPYSFSANLRSLGGWVNMRGNGLHSGAYRETAVGLGYAKDIPKSLNAQLEFELLQVAIDNYGSAWSQQVNARLIWTPNNTFSLAVSGINLAGSDFGQGGYPLPRRIAIGGKASPYTNLAFFLELDQDLRYDLSPRFGAHFSPIERITLLAALQGEPDVVSFGVSAALAAVRATLGFQFHPDLGLSQCYGLAVAF